MKDFALIAACPMGLESIVAHELKELGMEDVRADNGKVHFRGDAVDICRANLWLRTADRVLILMGQFKATTFDELFEGVKAIDWAHWLPKHAEFPVEGRSHKSLLSSVPACQGIVKKAIVEKMKLTYRTEWFEENGPRYVIEVALLNDIATITLDTTGPSLHKRGYRKLITEAPLKETLAAAMVLLSRWSPDRPLYDPFCGSGTIPIEAAMIGWKIAPGSRRSFPSQMWPIIGEQAWTDAKDEAFDLFDDSIPLQIAGSDIDPEAIKVAEAAVKSAGLSREIKFEVKPVDRAKPRGDYGCLLTNPPYGERLGDKDTAEKVLRQLGNLSSELVTWSTYVLTPNRSLEHYFGRKSSKNRKLFNGRIECHLYQYFGPRRPSIQHNPTEQ